MRTIEEAPDPKAVVRSLGRVPLSGHETAAEHWFSLVYERAAVLAGALAAAGGLLGEPDEECSEVGPSGRAGGINPLASPVS
ncbi:MAG TPA: hypothetical protein DEA70_02995 [Acidimicrobiaceae bacterium]|nr:hypothetical protein [Acidimicrobiaceae bacterium]